MWQEVAFHSQRRVTHFLANPLLEDGAHVTEAGCCRCVLFMFGPVQTCPARSPDTVMDIFHVKGFKRIKTILKYTLDKNTWVPFDI